MFRLPQREMDLRPGDGPPIVLADVSGSVPYEARKRMEAALGRLFHGPIPTMRVFAFIYGVAEVPFEGMYDGAHYSRGINASCPPDGFRSDRERYAPRGWVTNRTYLGRSMAEIEHLRPSLLIVMSDGGWADHWRALRIADRLGCPIDCYFFNATDEYRRYENPQHLADLARRSRGSYIEAGGGERLGPQLQRSLAAHLPKHEAPMTDQHRIAGARLGIQMPARQVHRVTRVTDVIVDDVINIHSGTRTVNDHTSAYDALIAIGESEVAVAQPEEPVVVEHKPRGLLSWLIGPAGGRAAREQDRGALREVASAPAGKALPAPQSAAPRLSAPQTAPASSGALITPEQARAWGKSLVKR